MHLGLHRRRDWTTIETFHSTCSKSENAPCTALAGTWISQLVQEQCTLFVQSSIDVQNLSVLPWATFHLATWPSSQLPSSLISRPMQLTKKGEPIKKELHQSFKPRSTMMHVSSLQDWSARRASNLRLFRDLIPFLSSKLCGSLTHNGSTSCGRTLFRNIWSNSFKIFSWLFSCESPNAKEALTLACVNRSAKIGISTCVGCQ